MEPKKPTVQTAGQNRDFCFWMARGVTRHDTNAAPTDMIQVRTALPPQRAHAATPTRGWSAATPLKIDSVWSSVPTPLHIRHLRRPILILLSAW